MPTTVQIPFSYARHDSWQDLSVPDRELVEAARAAAGRAYAEYSKFEVGAALRMADGTIVVGNNQENASYPAGICAERTALHAAMSQNKDGVVTTMAVMVPSVLTEPPVSPCGICRQALLEQEGRQNKAPLRLLLAVPNGPVYEIATASHLLPLYFDKKDLARR
ncbi:MAG: cytidine deaminase [Flavobacteriales bacterium]